MGNRLNDNSGLRICGPFAVYSGYANMSRAVLRTALLAGYEVSAIESDLRMRVTRWGRDGRTTFEPHLPKPSLDLPPMQEPELRESQTVYHREPVPTVLVQTPWNLGCWPQYGDGPVIGYTMTESDNLCAYWRHSLRTTDFALAPSQYVLDTFRQKTHDVPSELLPIPVDERPWLADDTKEDLREAPPFLFLCVFTVAERKAWRQLLVAFAEEFQNEGKEVGLIIKANPPDTVEQLADSCRQMGAWVQVDGQPRNWWSIATLYRACNVYVCPSCEGFGLPIVEAAYCGLPSVVLDKGGSADVCDETTGYVCPSHMAPIVGHMPHFYDRKKDRFAVFDIDDMRATLRRAYEEEKAGRAKGIAARERALERYRPEAIAPKFREMVERGVEIHREAVRKTQHPARPQWATLAGAWGDVFCAIGNIREMMHTKEMEKVGIIWYGRDPKIADWLRLQPWVREVVAIVEPDKKTMTLTYGKLCQVKPQYGREAWCDLLFGHDIDGPIAFTHLCLAEERTPKYWTGAVLSEQSHEWAETVARAAGGPFILLNPLSVASNTMADHWPHWGAAIKMLTEVSSCKIVLVGENVIEWEAHPNLLNVSGLSKSMQDVLALAERAAGIVTTGNNLGHYAIIAQKPGVVAFARTAPKSSFYHKFNEQPEEEYDRRLLSLVEFTEPFADFQRAMHERFPQFMGEATVPPVTVSEPPAKTKGRKPQEEVASK